jgi:hypothetical protein
MCVLKSLELDHSEFVWMMSVRYAAQGTPYKNHSQQEKGIWFLLSSVSHVSMSVIYVHMGISLEEALGCKLPTQ